MDAYFLKDGSAIQRVFTGTIRLYDGSRILEPVAKATWVKTQKVWKIFWMRADLRWHGYEPLAQVRTLDDVLAGVDADPYGCFWG